ncbi:hypothetical protein B0H13DRAFT_2654964 [Mycena leptocephala]|nr:hypothetical protein B0H13DRAFT_2654964 [Mycena leptocephala]
MTTPPPATDPSWRKNGHQYQDVPPAVQTHVREELKMSPLMRGLFLPRPKLSVARLAEFTLPPMSTSSADYKFPAGHDFFSNDGNHSDLDLLTEIKLVSQARQRYLDGAESICIPGTGYLYPFWVLELWSELQLVVKPAVDAWADGIKHLTKPEFKGYQLEVKQTLRSLGTLAWTGSIPLDALKGGTSGINSLTRYLSRDWFSSEQMDQMLDLLQYDIQKKTPSLGIQMMSTAITTGILAQITFSNFGKSIKNESDFAGIFHVNDNHWVGTSVDGLGKSIEFGDPGGGDEEDVDVCAALQWFIDRHLENHTLSPSKLNCTTQNDSHNCGLYAPNAIAHKFLPNEYRLFSSDVVLGDLGRLEILRRVIGKFHESQGPSVVAAPDIIAQRLNEYMNSSSLGRRSRSPSPGPPSTPPWQEDGISSALGQLSVFAEKVEEKAPQSGGFRLGRRSNPEGVYIRSETSKEAAGQKDR